MNRLVALIVFTLLVPNCKVRRPDDAAVSPSTQDAGTSLPATPTVPLFPEDVTFTSGRLTLHGLLYRPSRAGHFPAIVFNHGSERVPGSQADQAEFYVARGFVLLAPHRRGQGRSTDAGAYIDDLPATGAAFVSELVAQTDDVMDAVAYVGSLPFVDPRRVAVVGCSLGGIVSLFAAERGTGLFAAIDFAGASITWTGNPTLQQRMKLAARSARVPVLFLQAANDYNTEPSRELAAEMLSARKLSRAHIYPANGSTPEEGHAFCRGGQRPAWGDEVLEFLSDPIRMHE